MEAAMPQITDPCPDESLPSLAPLDWRDFAAMVENLGASFPLTLAVSGGGDSMALAVLAVRWADAVGWTPPAGLYQDVSPVTAITVDHGLRPQSGAEADWVAEQMAALGIDHVILRRDGPHPSGNLQAEAREARYGLMEAWCRSHERPTLLTGHTIEDQAETVMMRLARGSGVDGLSAMSGRTMLADDLRRPSVALLRPLLEVSRSRLRATCTAARQPWLEDPSNEDPRFARVRMRKLADHLAHEGLTAERLAATASGFARAREALDMARDTLLAASATFHEAGYVVIEGDIFGRAPREIGLRALAAVLQTVGGQAYRPRLRRLENVYDGLCGARGDKARTLARCRIAPHHDRYGIVISRENRNPGAPAPLVPGAVAFWDGRYRVSLPAGTEGGDVRALGSAGYRLIRDMGIEPCEAVPQAVRATLPALWQGDTLIAAPHAGFDLQKSGFKALFVTDRLGLGPGRDVLTGSWENTG
jgi:tRNA(Ile)-lysidine synthase